MNRPGSITAERRATTAPDQDRATIVPAATHTADVWAVAGYRAGERNQIAALAAALGRPWRELRLRHNRLAGPLGLLRGISIAGLADGRTALPGPPWPRLVITAGVRNEPIARWIRMASGAQTRIVFIGRSWAPPTAFDLTVTTPQYRVRSHPRVMENPLTLHDVAPPRLAADRPRWQPPPAGPDVRGRLTVLVGGNAGPYVFDARAAQVLASQLRALADRDRLQVLVTTSSRTLPAAVDVLARAFPAPDFVYRWQPDDPANPFRGMLAWADSVVVTADSVAMVSEAIGTARPVRVFDPLRTPGLRWVPGHLRAGIYRAAMHWAPRRLTRDVDRVLEPLYRRGVIAPLDGATPRPDPTAVDPMPATLARVHALLDGADPTR